MKRGDHVEIIQDNERQFCRLIKAGTKGKVLSTRPAIDDQVLVKFVGHSIPRSVAEGELRSIVK